MKGGKEELVMMEKGEAGVGRKGMGGRRMNRKENNKRGKKGVRKEW